MRSAGIVLQDPPVWTLSEGNEREVALPSEFDRIEGALSRLPQVDAPVTHRFTPGMYIREVRFPAGVMVTSEIHRTEHPFVLSQGELSVFIEGEGWVRLRAPLTGITKPGTRRLAYIHKDVIWTTFHAIAETNIEKIKESILVPRTNPLLANLQETIA